jgi:membrane protease YdiL (CAAX protease family)
MNKICKMARVILSFFCIDLIVSKILITIYTLIYSGSLNKLEIKEIWAFYVKGVPATLYIHHFITFSILSDCLFIIIYLIKNKKLIEEIKFNKFDKTYIVPIISICPIVAAVWNYFYILHFTPTYQSKALTLAYKQYNPNFVTLSVCILFPMLEEIMFRGILFNALRKYCNVNVAIVLQALIFALYHIASTPILFLNALSTGLIIGIIYLYSNSIIASILCHISTNLLGGIIYTILVHIFGVLTVPISLLALIFLLRLLILKHKESLNSTIPSS